MKLTAWVIHEARIIPLGKMPPLASEVTVTDPVTQTASWTVKVPWRRDDSYQFCEYACHEDNEAIRNYIVTSRARRAKQAAAKADTAVAPGAMFGANATDYYNNGPFRAKMLLLVLAGLNMLFFQKVTFRKVSDWDSGHPPAAARLAGPASLCLWCGVIGFGRWTGFTVEK